MQIDLCAARVVPAAPAQVFALVLDPQRFPALFSGCGPIPAIRRITIQLPANQGSTRELENSDGSHLTEQITQLDPPHRHAYTLTGMRPPFAWLVRAGHADWTFAPATRGTTVVWRYRWELSSPIAWPFASILLHGFMRTAMRRCLAAISRTLDSTGQ